MTMTTRIDLNAVTLVYIDEKGGVHEQPVADVTDVGTLIDPGTGDDMQLVHVLVKSQDDPVPDATALDTLALGLGTKQHWSADDLEWIAMTIASVRPSPGADVTPVQYLKDWVASGRTVPDAMLLSDEEKGLVR